MTDISLDEKRLLDLARSLELSFDEIKLVMSKGVIPATEAISQYKQPPWSKENLFEMDTYYEQLRSKYCQLANYINGNAGL